MSSISISNLHPAGFELLEDSESYLRELSEGEFCSIQGGDIPFPLRVVAGGLVTNLFSGPLCTAVYASYIATRYWLIPDLITLFKDTLYNGKGLHSIFS